ncbi:recombinase family protein [Bradyrhizobium liaoningense]|uniref:recombinase family protein n=1 Tax=Bradyrhizobium liaoningense TaxID=43992 RepID=UPI00201174D8|nr:recombinase family protein [Bradyrhizobium liaoningense]
MVTRIDRLARSTGDLRDIVRIVKLRGASLRATNNQSTPARRPASAFWICSVVFAGFETNLRRERQLEGIDRGQSTLPSTKVTKRPSTPPK